jgi:hypothetical protein
VERSQARRWGPPDLGHAGFAWVANVYDFLPEAGLDFKPSQSAEENHLTMLLATRPFESDDTVILLQWIE